MKHLTKSFVSEFKRLSKFDRLLIFGTSIFMLLLSLMDAFALSLLSDTLRGASSKALIDEAPSFVLIVALFVTKSIFTAVVTYFTMRHFERIEVNLGTANIESVEGLDWSETRQFSLADITNLFDKSPYAIANSLLFSGALFISELLTTAAIAYVVLRESLISSAAGLLFFTLVLLVQSRVLGKLSHFAGIELQTNSNKTQDRIFEFFHLGKLLKVSSAKGIIDELNLSRKQMIRSRINAWYLNAAPRYYMEAVLVSGLIVVAFTAYITEGESAVFPALSLFAAAGYRLLPTINRMQGYALTAIAAAPYIELSPNNRQKQSSNSFCAEEMRPLKGEFPNTLIKLVDVSFNYSDSSDATLSGINLDIEQGKSYALVGPSGSGKTTLADLCLGILKPSGGQIWSKPGLTVAYVPQDTVIISGTLLQNITLSKSHDSDRVRRAAEDAALGDLLNSQSSKNLSQLSGGQKQRIGLARALYRGAMFTVFDEATSALDNDTENQVVENINSLKNGGSTIMVIAHRLSTVRDVDTIILLDGGQISHMGTWDELIDSSPSFRRSVSLGDINRSAPNDN